MSEKMGELMCPNCGDYSFVGSVGESAWKCSACAIRFTARPEGEGEVEGKGNVIELAERLVRMARTGELRGFMAVLALDDAMQTMDSGGFEPHRMIGSLVVLQCTLVSDIVNDREDAPEPGPRRIDR